MRTFLVVALLSLLISSMAAGAAWAQESARDTLEIYLVDVEGGNATLLVAPSNEALLIDTGNGGERAERDVGRIMEAVEAAGLSEIDHLITTHWHGDHYGGMAELATRLPIRNFIDHGSSVQPNPTTDEFVEGAYQSLVREARRTVVRPGETIPLAGVNLTVMASGGEGVDRPLPGAGGPNPYCAGFEPQAEDKGENAQSVGVHFSFGRFRGLHLGDLTVNKEFELMCPNNPIGTVDLFVVSHHGLPTSNSAALVHAIEPRVALMNNGTRKGGDPRTMTTLYSSPGLEDLWQLHFSVLGGQEYAVPGLFIANHFDEQPAALPVSPTPRPARGSKAAPPPAHEGPSHWLHVAARRDGSFTVTNTRNGFSKTY